MKLVVVLLGLLSLASARQKSYELYQQWEVVPKSLEQIKTLREWMLEDTDIDFWMKPTNLNVPVQIMVPPRMRPIIANRLQKLGLEINIVNHNVGETIEAERQRLANKPRSRPIDLDDYNTYEDIMAWMDEIAANCPTTLVCDTYIAGYSYEGRELKALHISNPSVDNAAVYWVDATIHAREWLTTATLLKIMDFLIYQYGTDPDATNLLDNREWYFMPIVNPDGYTFTWTDDRLWRKNRRPTDGTNCIGTDLNRNFDFRWCMEGASTNPCADTFCGSSGGSEPETQVVSAESARIASSSNQRAWITMHSYGQMWMFPWGNTENHEGQTCERADDHAEMEYVAEIAADAIEATYNTRWSRGTSCEVIYETTGGTDDYVKGTDDWQHAICPELRGNGFVVPPSEIQPSFEEIWNGLVAMVGEV